MPSKQNKSVQKSSSALQKLKKKVRLAKSRTQAPSDKVFGVNVVPAQFDSAPRKRAAGSKDGGLALSKCALKYALAISKPFHPAAKLACTPAFPAPPSHKVTGYGRYLATIGTGGYGFTAITPCLGNDSLLGYTSTAAYSGTTALPLANNSTPSNGISRVTMSNLPYTTAQITGSSPLGGAQIYGRIVSVGMRVTYIGTTLNESGYYTLLATPAHENVLQVAGSPDTAGAFGNAQVCGITRESCEATLFPVSSVETDYTQSTGVSSYIPYIYPYSGNAQTMNNSFTDTVAGFGAGSPSMIVHFTGVPGSQFLVEVIQHVEYTGRAASANYTPTESDQRGFEIVSAAAERIPELKNSMVHSDPLDLMKAALSEVAKAVKPIAVSVLTNIGVAMLA